MNIKQAKTQIRNTLRAYLARDEYGAYRIPPMRQRPVLLMGPPGIGKTQIMEQIASEEQVGLVSYTITHHTRQSAMGLPFIEKRVYGGETYTVTEYTMSEIIGAVHALMENTGIREGILFLDEINCVSETLAPMMLQFLQNKTFGNQRLPEGWLIVAAGNPPEYNKSVRDFDVVTLDRVKRIDVTEDFAVWKEYARQKGLHGAVVSYLDIKKENFYRIENTPEGLQFATARGWEDLSELLYVYEDLGIEADESLVVQYVQMPALARDFMNYLRLYNKYRQVYHVEDILQGRAPAVTKTEFAAAPFDEKLAVMGLLLAKLSEASRDTRRQDGLCQALYDDLSGVKGRMEGEAPADVLREILETRRASLKRAAAAGQNDREKQALAQAEINRLEEYGKLLAGMPEAEGEAQFAAVKGAFSRETELRRELAERTGAAFSNVFSFLEQAVGRSWCSLSRRSPRASTPPGLWRSSAVRPTSATTRSCSLTSGGSRSWTKSQAAPPRLTAPLRADIMIVWRMIFRIIRCQTCCLTAKSIESSIDFAIRCSIIPTLNRPVRILRTEPGHVCDSR